MKTIVSTGQHIMEQQAKLADAITDMQFMQHPDLETKYGKTGREKCGQDSRYTLSFLAEAIGVESPEIFTAYLEWAQVMLKSRNVPLQDLLDNLEYTGIACKHLLQIEDYQVVSAYLSKGVECLQNLDTLPLTFLTDDNPLQPYAQDYLSLLLEGRRKPAHSIITDLTKQNQPVHNIHEQIFRATQYEVGRLWQTNKITVAHEHFCTAATQANMYSLDTDMFETGKKGPKMLGCTVSGDQHELGIRMITDFFEMDGWQTYYLGANMPDINIISAAKEQKVDVLAISVTMPFYISKAEKLIAKIRNDEALKHLKTIVGGQPFVLVPDLWKRIGADGTAREANEVVSLANQLIAE